MKRKSTKKSLKNFQTELLGTKQQYATIGGNSKRVERLTAKAERFPAKAGRFESLAAIKAEWFAEEAEWFGVLAEEAAADCLGNGNGVW